MMQQIQHIGHRKVRVPSAFSDGIGKIPNNPVVAAAVAAMLNGGPRARYLKGGWRDSEDGIPIYRLYGRKGGCISITIALDRLEVMQTIREDGCLPASRFDTIAQGEDTMGMGVNANKKTTLD